MEHVAQKRIAPQKFGENHSYDVVGTRHELKGLGDGDKDASAVGVSFWVGVSLTINFMMGSGFLTLPWAFYQIGLELGAILLSMAAFVMLISALFEAEVMCRAEAFTLLAENALASSESISGMFRPGSMKVLRLSKRVFDVSDLCGIFVGPKLKFFYLFMLAIYTYATLWVYAVIFVSSVSAHIPVSFIGDGSICVLSSDNPCTSVYNFYMLLFSLFMVPISLLNLSEQTVMQILTALARAAVVVAMLGAAVVASRDTNRIGGVDHFGSLPPYSDKASGGEKAETFEVPLSTSLAGIYGDKDAIMVPAMLVAVAIRRVPISAPLWRFRGLPKFLPIAVFSQMLNAAVSVVVEPLKMKDALHQVIKVSFGVTFLVYLSLGVVLAGYFGSNVKESVVLNWATYNPAGEGEVIPWWAYFIKALILLFPAVDVLSAFPLNVICLANNLMAGVYGERAPEMKQDRWTSTIFRLVSSVPPIIGALLLPRLTQVLDYTGVVGIFISFIVPPYLQMVSSRWSIQKFGPDISTPYSTIFGGDRTCVFLMCLGVALSILIIWTYIFDV